MRSSGILMHLSSLPSPYGIGSLGEPARRFADFLCQAGQSYWQILPICPTSYGDSPYQTFSSQAGNPYFIDLEELERAGYLKWEEYGTTEWGSTPDRIHYGVLYEKRYPVLRKAAARFRENPPSDYAGFCQENAGWLEDYALFMALKDAHGGTPWHMWEPELRNREPEALEEACRTSGEETEFWKICQYLFFSQWKTLREYVNGKGIRIIGDLPIYAALDSADVWAHPEQFQLDENRMPREVAGCPPDGFTDDGQLWGNPLFDWEYMDRDGYSWWAERIGYLCQVYDVLRIDHFRGFDSYYAIPYGRRDAREGRWREGPGMRLFRAVEEKTGRQPIIAEDLGYMTDSVRRLLADSGFPGMRVMEFAFDRRDGNNAAYLPHNYVRHCVAYTGTHDNDTILGWLSSADLEDAACAVEYLRLSKEEGYHWGMMRALWGSTADLTIVQAQDLLGLGSWARMNTPGTVGNNWKWRAREGSFTEKLAARLHHEMELYERLAR